MNAESPTWQQIKSNKTRTTILDAALEVLYDLGYAKTTTEAVARQAGVSRGAMLHHFPNRQSLIEATIKHLHSKRLATYREQETRTQAGARYTRIEEGIDAYWQQLISPNFTVLMELKIAARTDEQLAQVLAPTMEEFDQLMHETTRAVFPDLAQSEAFDRANLVSRYLLEGMAMAYLGNRGAGIGEDVVLDILKRLLHEQFQDVHGTVPRSEQMEKNA